MQFDVYGEYEITMTAKRRIDRESLKTFWSDLEKNYPGLSNAVGCYVFGIKAAGGSSISPWYVGKTLRSFKNECFQPHKLVNYNDILADYKKGRPRLYLLPNLTNKGRFSKNASSPAVDFLEKYLISLALRANPNLLNIKDTKMYRDLTVTGIFNSSKGAWHNSSRSLKKALKL